MQPDDNDIVFDTYGVDFTPIFQGIYNLFAGGKEGGDGLLVATLEWLNTIWIWWSVLAFFLSFLFIFGIIYSYLRINEYSALMTDKLAREHQAWLERQGASPRSSRWQQVQEHVQSDRPNDWKLAIIEADILLGEALDRAGYAGASIGDQLKSVSTIQLPSVQDAWDAHLIRNKIAHEGADFVLTQGAAREAIIKHERVFRDLGEV